MIGVHGFCTPSGVNGTLGFASSAIPLGCTKHHGPRHSVQQLYNVALFTASPLNHFGQWLYSLHQHVCGLLEWRNLLTVGVLTLSVPRSYMYDLLYGIKKCHQSCRTCTTHIYMLSREAIITLTSNTIDFGMYQGNTNKQGTFCLVRKSYLFIFYRIKKKTQKVGHWFNSQTGQ